jgi:hypothetical protein
MEKYGKYEEIRMVKRPPERRPLITFPNAVLKFPKEVIFLGYSK